jgi:hypothetical protein
MPDAQVAITHDNEWCAVIGEVFLIKSLHVCLQFTLHKDENVIPNASKLLDRICAMYNVDFEGGELSSA